MFEDLPKKINEDSMEDLKNELTALDPTKYIHAANYLQKFKNQKDLTQPQIRALDDMLPEYIRFMRGNRELSGYGKDVIKSRTDLLNAYLDFIHSHKYDNVFSSQSKFRPTIMEEFMFVIFSDMITDLKTDLDDSDDMLKLGGIKAYTNLYFSAKNLKEFTVKPEIGVNQKDQDFAIYRPITLNIEQTGEIQANLPVVAIENKTYVDKTMLEGSIATSEKIKSGNPYSLFIIVTETYDVDLTVDPAYSRIDQIYVLRKSKRKEARQPIDSEVLFDMAEFIQSHLKRDWSDIENKMRQTGKII